MNNALQTMGIRPHEPDGEPIQPLPFQITAHRRTAPIMVYRPSIVTWDERDVSLEAYKEEL